MTKKTQTLNKTWNYFLDLIFPKVCVGCGQEGGWICKKCSGATIKLKTFYCPNCKTITPNGQYCSACTSKYRLTGILIAAHYKHGPLREAIHAYKYEGIKELKIYLSNVLLKRLKGRFPRGKKVIIPIPLHKKREAIRGFNQAEELSKTISEKLNIPLKTNVIKRVKETKPQMELRKKKRAKNIKKAFKLIKSTGLKNKTILLVDDITTTGLTLNEAAKVLRKAGAREIWGVVIAQG